jgi:acyl-CoA synthetase (NDP forming)
MSAHRLQPLVAPASVAVVGATPRVGAVGNEVLVNLQRGQYPGALYAVNPGHESILGIDCYPDLAALPEVPQHVIFALGDRQIEAALDDAIALGVPAATIYSALLLEKGDGLRERVADKLRAAGMLLAGGNGMGIYNFRERFWACGFDTRAHPQPGNVVLLSQSGSGMSGILDCEERLDFLFAASTGQELLVGVEDYLDYVLDLPETGVVGLFLETSRQPDKLTAAFQKAADKRIPIVALKVGRTELSARMAVSHSGALAGSDASYQAIFDRYGVQRVADMDELATALILFSRLSLPETDHPEPGLVCLHDSGGERQLMIDLAEAAGVPFATLGEATVAQLESRLDPGLPAVNPLDGWGAGGADADDIMTGCLSAMLAEESAALGAVVHDRGPAGAIYPGYLDYLEAAHAATGKPVCLVASRQGTGADPLVVDATRRGFPVLDGVSQFLAGVRCLLGYRSFQQRPPVSMPALSPAVAGNLRAQMNEAALSGSLGEHLSSALLSECGLTMNTGMLVDNAEQVAAVAEQLHYPVVLKTAAADHKTDVNGVLLSIDSAAALEAAYADLSARLGPQAYISPMIDAPGVEMILGARRDPQFGPMVVLGFGGVHAETLQEFAVLAAPFDTASAERALAGLKLAPLLQGVRGAEPVDVHAFCEMAARLSAMVVALADRVLEVDINPVKLGPWGVLGLDALVVLNEAPAVDEAVA